MISYLKTFYLLTIGPESILLLAADWWTKFKIATLLIVWPGLSWLKFGRLLARLDLIFEGKKFYFVADGVLDLINLQEIFVKRVYQVELRRKKPVILDLGAGNGDSTIFYKLLYPTSQVFAFEPQPDNWGKLLLNTKQFDGVTAFLQAVGAKNGPVRFYLYPRSSLSSSLTRRMPNQETIKREMVTLDRFIKNTGLTRIDLIKFDIEGGEVDAFRKFRQQKMVQFIIGELHFDLMKASREDVAKIFSDFRLTYREINNRRAYVFGERYE